MRENACGGKRGGRQRNLGELSDQDADVTLVMRRKEIVGWNSLGLQCSSKEVQPARQGVLQPQPQPPAEEPEPLRNSPPYSPPHPVTGWELFGQGYPLSIGHPVKLECQISHELFFV